MAHIGGAWRGPLCSNTIAKASGINIVHALCRFERAWGQRLQSLVQSSAEQPSGQSPAHLRYAVLPLWFCVAANVFFVASCLHCTRDCTSRPPRHLNRRAVCVQNVKESATRAARRWLRFSRRTKFLPA
eukprot:6180166-Pleurochrysis_carterae.AAC.2